MRAKDIVCKRCGKPLNGSRAILACTDEILDPRIVIKYSNCGYALRFEI